MTAAAARFLADLSRLSPGKRLGVAVSGGPDSLALLLLASSACSGRVEAATVDHQLRSSSRAEADQVGAWCAQLGVSHTTLPVDVAEGASLQAQARQARYAALATWAAERDLTLLTAHHADDQAETLLMRLNRGAGLSGLAGVRAATEVIAGDGHKVRLLRPLLSWRKHELQRLVAEARLNAFDDPSNIDPRHDRSRVRALLASSDLVNPLAVAASAAHLAEAEQALAFAVERLALDRVVIESAGALVTAGDLPRELQRRLLLAAMAALRAPVPRGPDLDRALLRLQEGGSCTLSGLRLSSGKQWRLAQEPPRRAQ